jgi:CheY-like chemotaxis protein/DNA-binding HxlR family transcriptional regulator
VTEQKILVVEDELYAAIEITSFIEKLNYISSGIASSGEQALKMIEKEKPDLILMDIVLDENGKSMDGIKTTRMINEKYDIPIIFITAYKDEDKIRSAVETGPYGYIIKPVTDESEIRAAIAIALHNHKSKQIIKDRERKLELIEKIVYDEKSPESSDSSVSDGPLNSDDQINYMDENVENWFNALGNTERLKIIKFLTNGPKQFDEVVNFTGKVKSTVSHHLSILERVLIMRVTRKRISVNETDSFKNHKNGLITQYSLGNIPRILNMITSIELDQLSKSLSALGSKERLSIIENLRGNALMMDDFRNLMKKSESTISRHLRILQVNELILAEKKGRSTIYSLNNAVVGQFMNTYIDFLTNSRS